MALSIAVYSMTNKPIIKKFITFKIIKK